MSSITPAMLRALKWSGKDQRINAGDNLYLLVRKASNTWLFRGTVRGKRISRVIGTFPDVSLKDARALAYNQKFESERPQKRLFSALSADYLAEVEYRQMKQLQGRVAILNKTFGHRDISTIEKSEIVTYLRNYRKQSPSMSNQLRIHLSQVFKHGIGLGWIESNPVEGIPVGATGYKPKACSRVLSADEIRAIFWHTSSNAHVLRFMLLTGLRSAEALTGLLKNRKYIVEAKGGRSHWVHVTGLAMRQTPLPFRKPKVVSQWCKREDLGYTPHDLRRTFATLANGNGVEPFIVERVLGHKLPGIMATYNLAEYEKERIHCAEVVEAAVLSILAELPDFLK